MAAISAAKVHTSREYVVPGIDDNSQLDEDIIKGLHLSDLCRSEGSVQLTRRL